MHRAVMNQDVSASETELHDMSGINNLPYLQPIPQTASRQSLNSTFITAGFMEDADNPSRPQSPLSTNRARLIATEQLSSPKLGRVILLHCLLHMIPLSVTVAIFTLNILGIYWQDLGRPSQNTILQALQYAAKAHELTITASLTAIAVHRLQHRLDSPKGVPLGFLTAGFQLSDPFFICRKEFLGGARARVQSGVEWRSSTLTYLLILGFALTSVVGPSSAVAMIPRLDWWKVSMTNAFGPEYRDRLYFNRTEAELWPANITNAIYADLSACTPSSAPNQDCAVEAADFVGPWIYLHQSEGTSPNITVFQDSEVARYLTSQGGPPENSSRTVSSTVGSIFAKDLNHYWDWLAENSSLPTRVSRPMLRPAFINQNFKIRKPLVQAQCYTYFDPDWEYGIFEFPHDELLTPPLHEFKNSTWSLGNDFVLSLKGNDSDIGNPKDASHPWILFDWFDTASNFSNQGAPSIGAVIIYKALNRSIGLVDAMTTCSFDGRWVPAEYYLDPKDTKTIYQDSPNPMEIVDARSKEAGKEVTQMRMTLEWANTMNIRSTSSYDPSATVVEQMLEGFSGGGNFIFPESPRTSAAGYVMKTIDWRLSTALGLYLTEGLAHAFSDESKGSMLYRQAPKVNESYVRYLNDINQPALKEGYRNGKLDWVEMRDPRWNSSILPWDEWAPQNGYTEIVFNIQRNGYGYGFDGVPVKLAATVLAIYIVLVCAHIISLLVNRRIYKGSSKVSHMLTLAWNSVPTEEMRNVSAGTDSSQTWSQVVRVKKEDQCLQLVLEK